jgi:predicted dehydrogenase
VLRVALVGCGKAAENHVREIRKIAGARVVAVSDIEPLMAEQLAVRHGIPAHFRDLDVLLDTERPDVVHITAPPQSHLSLAAKALDAGAHVFVEKPLTPSRAESQQLVSHAVSRNRKLTIGYGYHFDPIARTMRRLIADGVLGTPVHVESFIGYDLSGSFGSCVLGDDEHWVRRLPGKLIHNVIDHLLSKVAEFVTDQATVHARAWQRAPDRHPNRILLDELRVMIVDGDTSAVATFTAHARPVAHLLNVYGTRNTARLDFEAGTIMLASSAALPGALGRVGRTFGQGLECFRQGARNALGLVRSEYHALAGLNFLIGTFYESIRRDTPVPIPYQDILKIAALTDAVLAQLPETRPLVA